MIDINLIEITQPIGTFYVGKIDSSVLINISRVNRRVDNHDNGIQRDLQNDRVKEIANYCKDPDAAFPTPIVISINSEKSNSLMEQVNGSIYKFSFDPEMTSAEILDGQHRVEGIKRATDFETELMVAIMFDLTEEEKAYVFSTINSNQKKVDKSLIYDLFEISTGRSPLKTCHDIARSMNSSQGSPFYKKLKMLGKKQNTTEVLSQGMFVTHLVRLISKNPQSDEISIKNEEDLLPDSNLIFRNYFIENKDEIILKILTNYFGAVSISFNKEWNNEKYILAKSTGYGALLKALPVFYSAGIKRKTLTYEFFLEIFKNIKEEFYKNKKSLTSEQFGSGEQAQTTLANLFIKFSNLND